MLNRRNAQMKLMPLSIRSFIALAYIFLFAPYGSIAQTFVGLKAGANVSHVQFESEVYKQYYDTKFKPGYTFGAVFLIENKEKYGLYGELLYSVKGKSMVSHANDYETNDASYQFVDFPIMFRVKFKQRYFKWFAQVGPEMSYWLGGKGSFKIYEPDRNVFTDYAYKINFGEPKSTVEYMNLTEPNRLQIGLALGGGFIWELDNANFIALDIRYSMGHTFMGGFESGSIPNLGLVDNFEYTISTLSVSAVYYFDILEKLRLSKNKYRRK